MTLNLENISSQKKPIKILISRTDGIGDLILTLPMAALIKEKFPKARIYFLVKNYTKDIIGLIPNMEEAIIYDFEKKHKGFFGLIRLIKEIKGCQFDLVFLVRPKLSLAWCFFLSGVKNRISTSRRLYSFLFNHRVPIKRKKGGRHETFNNIQMLKPLDIDFKEIHPDCKILPLIQKKISKKLKNWKIKENFIIIHPGSKGSALRWPLQSMEELANIILSTMEIAIILTGSSSERGLLDNMYHSTINKLNLKLKPKKNYPLFIADDLTLMELGALYQKAAIVIANSTGPLHLAAILGTHTISLFPMSRQMQPSKWHPIGPGTNITIQPDIPDCPKCIGEKCKYFNCLSLVSADFVFQKIKSILGKKEKKGWIPKIAKLKENG